MITRSFDWVSSCREVRNFFGRLLLLLLPRKLSNSSFQPSLSRPCLHWLMWPSFCVSHNNWTALLLPPSAAEFRDYHDIRPVFDPPTISRHYSDHYARRILFGDSSDGAIIIIVCGHGSAIVNLLSGLYTSRWTTRPANNSGGSTTIKHLLRHPPSSSQNVRHYSSPPSPIIIANWRRVDGISIRRKHIEIVHVLLVNLVYLSIISYVSVSEWVCICLWVSNLKWLQLDNLYISR